MQLPDFLMEPPLGEVRLVGHRIGLYHLVHYYNEGYSPEMLLGQFPTLSLALIHKTVAFYLENMGDVDRYTGRYRESLDRQRAENPRRIDIVGLRERLTRMQAETRT